ncbi:MAG: hypothetical protein ACRDJU_03290 [Actinomycetota bacterium]
MVLGAATLRSLHLNIGSTVAVNPVEPGSTTKPLRMVGTAAFPEFGDGQGLNTGAATTFTSVEADYPQFAALRQGLTVVLAALLVGVPLGLAAGRGAWLIFSHRFGNVPSIAVPPVATLAIAAGALVAALLAALVPAGLASRIDPASAPRRE